MALAAVSGTAWEGALVERNVSCALSGMDMWMASCIWRPLYDLYDEKKFAGRQKH